MSSNGAGRISSAIRAGNRPLEDERNRLILPGIEVLEALQPEWFLLENVRRMENTVIRNERNQPENILTCLARRMHPFGYTLRSCILDFRNYGVPHHRERLITIGCRIPKVVAHFPKVADVLCSGISPFHPLPTHGEGTNQVWLTLRRAIGKLPCLDSRTNWKDPNDPYHCVPKWNDNQYFWMKNTPEGQTAFDNAYCVDCGTMKTNQDEVSCRVCRKPLPVPQMKKSGKVRLIKGFRSSYRRMWWDRPGGTLTMNSGVISSDLKGHPEQNRVLSLREILRLSTLDHQQWKRNYDFSGVALGKWYESQSFSARLVREVIGESIPPLAMKCMVDHLLRLETSTE
jgi:DNA (cytosine-5)-methyltransferase 1